MSAPFLTPSVTALLEKLGSTPPAGPSAADQRAALDGALAQFGWPGPADPDAAISLSSGSRTLIFRPRTPAEAAVPLIVHCHGGSFIAGGVPAHQPVARALAEASGCAVTLVDYRLAPEHPAPAAIDDVADAVARLSEGASGAGIDPARYALLGDSAGGLLAAWPALARPRGTPSPRALAFVNPMTSPQEADASAREFATGFFASAADFALGWRQFGPGGAAFDLLATPDLSRLPPLLVFTNEADPVRGQGELFAERLCRRCSDADHATARTRPCGMAVAGRSPRASLVLDTVAGALAARLRLR